MRTPLPDATGVYGRRGARNSAATDGRRGGVGAVVGDQRRDQGADRRRSGGSRPGAAPRTVRRGTASGIDGAYRRIAADSGHDRAEPPVVAGAATNVCVVLLDSLNRHLLGSYGGTEFATPNLDRFAQRARDPLHPPRDRARCRACRRATTSSSARSTSCGSRGDRSSCGSSRSPGCSAASGRHDDARHRPSAPVRDRRRELPRRLLGLGLRARPRGRRCGGPIPIRRGWARRRCRRAPPAGSTSALLGRRPDHPRLRPVAHVLPGRGGLPRTAGHDARRRGSSPTPRRSTTGGSCSSTSSTRTSRSTRPHPGSAATTTSRGRGAADLAAVRRRRHRARPAHRTRGPAHPRELRQQAVDDRRLVRPDPRRVRRARPVGGHGADRVHRPRALPR